MIYADFNGSAPLHPVVREYLVQRIQDGPYANPNAIHSLGKKMGMGLEKARIAVAKDLGAKPHQVIFNSGSSEGITHVYKSVLEQTDKKVIISSAIEHSAVVQANKYYQSQGFELLTVKTLPNGEIDIEDFQNIFNTNKDNIALVSVMAANNETGVIQNYKEISKLCNENKVLFFSDTTQYIGKTHFNFEESGMDFAVMSGHKIGAIIGSGVLLVKNPYKMIPLIFGGGQESGHRGGTQNYIGAETIAVALKEFTKDKDLFNTVNSNKLEFEKRLKESFPQIKIIGEDAKRLASTSLISYPGIHGQAVQIELESEDIFVTTSSACSDNEPETSKVLQAMNINSATGRGVVRISFCCHVEKEHYDKVFNALSRAYNKLKVIQ